MRLLSTFIAVLLASTTLTAQIAAACGNYRPVDPTPNVLMVSTHSLAGKGERWMHRSFVVLPEAIEPGANAKWQLLAPGTFDSTQILAMSPLATPTVLTLVGPSGVRVVKTDKQAALAGNWRFGRDKKRLALEVPISDGEHFPIAIPGRVRAQWHALGAGEGSAAVKWWLGKRVADAELLSLQPIEGTDYEIVKFVAGGKSRFVVRKGDRELTSAYGSPLGAVTVEGRLFVITKHEHKLATIELAATTRA